jgi:hypothetical protein
MILPIRQFGQCKAQPDTVTFHLDICTSVIIWHGTCDIAVGAKYIECIGNAKECCRAKETSTGRKVICLHGAPGFVGPTELMILSRDDFDTFYLFQRVRRSSIGNWLESDNSCAIAYPGSVSLFGRTFRWSLRSDISAGGRLRFEFAHVRILIVSHVFRVMF